MKSSDSEKVARSIGQLEKTLRETRAERMVIETINFRLEGEWVDHKKILKIVKGVLGPVALKGISKEPKV